MNREKLERFIHSFYRGEGRLQWNLWNYVDGCAVVAAVQLWEASGQELFIEYILRYADHFVMQDGKILSYRPEEFRLDDILPGRALLFAHGETGEEKYPAALRCLMAQLEGQPRTASGNYWHKRIYPNQVWLDGLYMAQPFRAEYAARFGGGEAYEDICAQFTRVREWMRDPVSGLYYHGFDESRSVFWADRISGLSRNFWLRAIGWYLMGIADTVEALPVEEDSRRQRLGKIYEEALEGLMKYQDGDTGLFYQVVDHPEMAGEGNYLETSGSAMTAASIFKACRLGISGARKYEAAAGKILTFLIDERIVEKGGKTVLTGTCSVAGLGPEPGRRDGSIAYYLSEPVADNDNKGIAALFMAYAQYLLLHRRDTSAG